MKSNDTSSEALLIKETLKEGLKDIEKSFKTLKVDLWDDIRGIIKDSIRESIATEVKSLHQTINAQRAEIDELKRVVSQLEMDRLKEQRQKIACNLILRGVDEINEFTEEQTRGTR